MKRFAPAALLAISAAGVGAQEKPTQFWNLTSATVTSLRLAQAGAGASGAFGANVAAGDADGIDHDERLKIVGLASGKYDLELSFKGGRVCIARQIGIVGGKVFSVEDKDLTDCNRK
jgi:hypothetical protein